MGILKPYKRRQKDLKEEKDLSNESLSNNYLYALSEELNVSIDKLHEIETEFTRLIGKSISDEILNDLTFLVSNKKELRLEDVIGTLLNKKVKNLISKELVFLLLKNKKENRTISYKVEQKTSISENERSFLDKKDIVSENSLSLERELKNYPILINLLNEIEDDNKMKFQHLFIEGWKEFHEIFTTNYETELEAVKQWDLKLKKLLDKISGIYFTNRYFILDHIAEICNNDLEFFTFISPEKHKKVDPVYHNVIGAKGLNILEGVSFLILRKGNSQVFSKAEVKTTNYKVNHSNY